MHNLTLRLNGDLEELAVHTLLDVLLAKGFDAEGKGIAVALNAQVIQRKKWAETVVKAHDDIEIVRARQGG